MPDTAERLNRLPNYAFSVINDQLQALQKRTGLDVIRLDIGSPDLPPPDFVVDTLETYARKPNTHGYSGYRGTPRFRQAVASYYERRFGVLVNPDTEVLPLLGSKEGLVNISLAYLDRGDVSLVPDIGYPSYAMGANMAGGDIHWMSLTEANGFKPDLDAIPTHVAQKAKLLWLNYPNNPTGVIVDLDYYREVLAFCRKHDILLMSDNPYVDITYDGYEGVSPLQIDGALDKTVEFMSFSKTYNMAGWRLGAAVGNADAIASLLRIKSNMDSGHFIPVYEAGIVALERAGGEWIQQRNAVYQGRRDMILSALPAIGLTAQTPKATLYVWARLEDGDAEEFVRRAREEIGISMAYGGIYGQGGEGYIRISLSVPDERLQIALERLKQWRS